LRFVVFVRNAHNVGLRSQEATRVKPKNSSLNSRRLGSEHRLH
jgi:hypothetical protein